MLTIEAPAKINLTLEILGKRNDGYHELRSVIQTVNLCDTLSFSNSDYIEIRCERAGWSAEKSLVGKAIILLRKVTGCKSGVTIDLEKHIPMMAGLGGDSSDAAAVLSGLNIFWGFNLPFEKLLELAPQLGADVAFFLYGGTCLMEGRGEKITPLPPIEHRWVILVVPELPHEPGKTKRMYESLKPEHFTDGTITEKLIADSKNGYLLEQSHLFNTFENFAFARGTEQAKYLGHVRKIGAPNIHLAGSGPTMYTLFQDKHEAEEIYARLQNQGMSVYLTETKNNL